MNPAESKIAFQRLVESLLDRAVDAGLQLPIVFVIVSVNGYVTAVRYTREDDSSWVGKVLVEGNEPRGVFPVNLCFFDPTGRVFNAKVDDPGGHPMRVH
jgi:hypothetical protein